MREVWITGCGLLSPLGQGEDEHWARLAAEGAAGGAAFAAVDSTGFAPFHVYPIGPFDLDRQIPRRGDQRAMEPLMRYGTYAAGMALQAAGIAGDQDLLRRTHLLAAAGGGERDTALDEEILNVLETAEAPGAALNDQLMNGLRPTLFLAQLPNLFAGNISIVHGVRASSRTFMGEEAAGVDAVRIAFERITADQGDLFLVGSAFNAARWDTHLLLQPGGVLLTGPLRGLWDRPRAGICLGSAGAFLVLEEREHARARGVEPLARLAAVHSDRCARAPGAAARNAARQWTALRPKLREGRPVAVMSGACGAGPITGEERAFLKSLVDSGATLAVRGTAAALGHSVEAAFLTNLILAISCLRRQRVFAPLAPEEPLERAAVDEVDQAVVTGWGHRRGEGMALLQTVD